MVNLDSENERDELAHNASKIRNTFGNAADDALKIPSRNVPISDERCVSSQSFTKSIEMSKTPRTCVTTISIGIADIKKKYASCAANPA